MADITHVAAEPLAPRGLAPQRIRRPLVDDHQAVRIGLRELLTIDPD
jgi:hypothetical protein